MDSDTGPNEACQRYAAALAAHYTTKDLREAFELYKDIVAVHPDSHEAGYSRAQIQNIVNAVIPKQELLDAQVNLVLTHFEGGEQPDIGPRRRHHAS